MQGHRGRDYSRLCPYRFDMIKCGPLMDVFQRPTIVDARSPGD